MIMTDAQHLEYMTEVRAHNAAMQEEAHAIYEAVDAIATALSTPGRLIPRRDMFAAFALCGEVSAQNGPASWIATPDAMANAAKKSWQIAETMIEVDGGSSE